MTPRQIDLVQQSWREAQPIADTVVRLFYRRLFDGTPGLRDRFQTSMSEQGDCLLTAIDNLLDRLEACPTLEIGVVEREVTEAWIWALEAELGPRCTFEVTDAWRVALSDKAAGDFQSLALGAAVVA